LEGLILQLQPDAMLAEFARSEVRFELPEAHKPHLVGRLLHAFSQTITDS
jgi:hypothetical protein